MSVKQFTILRLIFIALFAFAGSPAFSRTFYVDPQSGASSGDGSAAHPWQTLQQVIAANLIETQQPASTPYTWGQPLKAKNAGAPVKAGDTLLLRTGYHGSITISGAYNANYITVAAQAGNTPTASQVLLTGASRWIIRGLTVSPSLSPTYSTTANYANTDMIYVSSGNLPCRYITIDSCHLYTVTSTTGWSMSDWNIRAANGIESNSIGTTVSNNVMYNVNFGIQMYADSAFVDHNKIDYFCGDGMRGTGNDGTFQYNWVQGSLQVNGNHCDCFQSWSVGTDGVVGDGTVYRMKLVGNTFINYLDSNLQFQAQVQGIGCFDGLFQDWVVENNVIMVNQWHGITLAGAINCLVINNTICELRKTDVGPPWIEIGTHKNGTVSTGCVVRNNLTTDMQIEAGCQVTLDHNIIMKDPTAYFKDFASRDVCPKTGCAAIAGGSSLLAPATDIYGTPRPAAPDIGAVQHTGSTSVVPPARSSVPGREFSVAYANRHLALQLPENAPERITCTVSSLSGVVLVNRTLASRNGTAELSIPDNLAFPRGVYVVRLRGVGLDHALSLIVR